MLPKPQIFTWGISNRRGLHAKPEKYLAKGLSQKLFEQIRFGDLRLGCSEIFPLDGFVDLVSMDRNIARRGDADFYIAGTDAEYRDLDLVADNKTFIFFSRKN